MTTQKKNFGPNYSTITLKTSDGSTIQGKVNIASHQRVSDLFTDQKGPFVVVIDAVYSGGSGKTLFINKEHIIWVEPDDAKQEEE